MPANFFLVWLGSCTHLRVARLQLLNGRLAHEPILAAQRGRPGRDSARVSPNRCQNGPSNESLIIGDKYAKI